MAVARTILNAITARLAERPAPGPAVSNELFAPAHRQLTVLDTVDLASTTDADTYKKDLDAAASVFKSYEDTNILIEGHTDDTGSEEFNMALSERRAKAVRDYLIAQGVDASRLTAKWYGETQPKYPNDEANRAKNRRVELAIYANDEMINNAKEGNLD